MTREFRQQGGHTFYGDIKVVDGELFQLLLVNGKKEVQHLVRPESTGKAGMCPEQVKALCGNRIGRWKVTGRLFDEHKMVVLRIHHQDDFCQLCKQRLADLLSIPRLTSITTRVLSQLLHPELSFLERAVIAVGTGGRQVV